MAKRSSPERKYLTMSGLQDRWDCAHMTVERLIRTDPDFPPPMRLGVGPRPHRRWHIDAIEAYERSKIVARSA